MFYPFPPRAENQFLNAHALLMNRSFQRLLGYPLLNIDDNKLAEALFYAPFALLSHNTDDEPLFNYANAKGLALFELDWQQLIQLPSRSSAETINQAERDKLLAQVSMQGFIKNYQGIRLNSSGKRFLIQNTIIWNIHDEQGCYQGQAACFDKWSFLS